MKKMNKKGFTLIEMLVVIAIIAILVAIVIPTVTSATKKAAAATNAANLRSMIAEASTDYLAGVSDDARPAKPYIDDDGTVTFAVRDGAPKSKPINGVCEETTATIEMDNTTGTITAKYGEHGVDHFSILAEGKSLS